MNETKYVKGLKMIQEGISLLLDNLEAETVVPPKAEKNEVNNVAKEAPAVVVGNDITPESLDSMTYNDLKKLAKSLGISASGARPELTARILGVDSTSDEEAEEVPDLTDAPEEEPTGDEIADQVREIVADMSVSDIADILAEVGVSAKGKKEALTEKLIKAVKDGLISLDDEDDESEPIGQTETEPEEANTAEADEDESEGDDVNDLDNPNMTEERKAALIAFAESTKNDVANGELSIEDMRDFVKEFYDMKASEVKTYSDDAILDIYIDAASRFICDDGGIVEEEAYMLNGEPACCGHFLEYDEDNNSYHCSVCNNDYSAE